ncbi:MAG: hypothetical protein EZS28_030209 [Streblomastix strix]|uniref:SPRY domain-containing protein n=1 Tax=Streblomastix strix TaxID=222440 RepID=A0A5J4UVH2_9EUKA|nr:MAG: hypothetical protein EZS28_030209 [Streblomastix strix]
MIKAGDFITKIEANITFPQLQIVKANSIDNTMVIFNREIQSGIWEFIGKVTKMKHQFGIGVVDARQNLIPHPYDYENKNENSDEVRIVVDLKSEPHAFFLVINNKIQPFCVMNIPDKVKFMA